MNGSHVLLLAFAIGVIGGLRAITAPTVVAWAAHLGWINLHGTPLSPKRGELRLNELFPHRVCCFSSGRIPWRTHRSI